MPIDEYTRESVLELVRKGDSLEGLKLKGLDLSEADLRGGRLRGAHFRYSSLTGADLRVADLREANLRHVNLRGANLAEADLRGADFTHADIAGAIFTGARLAGARFDHARGLSRKVFFTQAQIDTLLAENTAQLDEFFEVPARGEAWRLVAAARVIDLEAGSDGVKILHRVLSEEQLKAMGFEVHGETAIMAETDSVYRLEPGFIGEPQHEGTARKSVPADEPPAVEPAVVGVDDKKSDQELINDFLLRRLSSS